MLKVQMTFKLTKIIKLCRLIVLKSNALNLYNIVFINLQEPFQRLFLRVNLQNK